MGFDKKYLGGLVITHNTPYIITGYDYMRSKYLMKAINDNHVSLYTVKKDGEIIHTRESAENKRIENERKIQELRKYVELYNKCLNSLEKQTEKNEYTHLIHKLITIHENTCHINRILGYALTDKDRAFFNRELLKIRKGFKRRLKRLYRYMEKSDYEKFVEYLEISNYTHPLRCSYRIECIEKENLYISSYIDKYDQIKYI